MNIDEKLNNMKPKDTPLLWLGYTILGMMLLLGQPANAQSASDNVILIDQAGDNLDLTIMQDGYGNKIGSSSNYADILGLNSTVTLKQWNRYNEI